MVKRTKLNSKKGVMWDILMLAHLKTPICLYLFSLVCCRISMHSRWEPINFMWERLATNETHIWIQGKTRQFKSSFHQCSIDINISSKFPSRLRRCIATINCWTDYCNNREIIFVIILDVSKTLQNNWSRWFKKIITPMVMLTPLTIALRRW